MPKQPKHLAVENKSPCASHCHQPSTAPKETDRCGLCKLPTSCRPEKHLDGQTTSRQAQKFWQLCLPGASCGTAGAFGFGCCLLLSSPTTPTSRSGILPLDCSRALGSSPHFLFEEASLLLNLSFLLESLSQPQIQATGRCRASGCERCFHQRFKACKLWVLWRSGDRQLKLNGPSDQQLKGQQIAHIKLITRYTKP